MFPYSKDGKWHCPKHGDIGIMDASVIPENGQLQVPVDWPTCPSCAFVTAEKLCVECEKHKATVQFSDSAMDYVHGFVEALCKCCYFKRVEKVFDDVKANYEK